MAPLLSTPLLRTQSDRRLTALAADGHDRAFEAIVERYRRPLQRYLRRLLSEALAEDVLQATFVRAWQALRAGTDVRELRPWLYRIAHNQALNTLRAAGSALPAVAAELPAISLEAEIERREDLRAALHGIEALPERQRAALVAIAVADRPHADVARELGMSDGALRQLLLRARTTLRAAATALTPYPLMSWLAGGQEATAARVAEVAVGAGGAGIGLKAGVAALAAGAVVRRPGPARRPPAGPREGQVRRTRAPSPARDRARGLHRPGADRRPPGGRPGRACRRPRRARSRFRRLVERPLRPAPRQQDRAPIGIGRIGLGRIGLRGLRQDVWLRGLGIRRLGVGFGRCGRVGFERAGAGVPGVLGQGVVGPQRLG